MHFITQVVWTTFWQLFPLFERPGRAKDAIQRLHDTQCQLGNMCTNISDHSDGKLESIFSSINTQGVGLPVLIRVGLMGWLGRTGVWKTMFWFSYWSQGFYWTYIYEDKKIITQGFIVWWTELCSRQLQHTPSIFQPFTIKALDILLNTT